MRLPAARFVGSGLDPGYLTRIHPIRPDQVMVQTAPTLLRKVWGSETGAMTLRSRIFIDPKVVERGGPALRALLMHEMVHSRQWKEQGTIRFLAKYLREYFVGRLTGASHREAYRAIEAEVEAREIATAFQ